jgi:hypothetical protein
MFKLAIDCKLRGCDLVNLRVRDVTRAAQIFASGDGRAAIDATAGAIGVDRADQMLRLSMDQNGGFEGGALSVPQPSGEIATCCHSAVCPGRMSVVKVRTPSEPITLASFKPGVRSSRVYLTYAQTSCSACVNRDSSGSTKSGKPIGLERCSIDEPEHEAGRL